MVVQEQQQVYQVHQLQEVVEEVVAQADNTHQVDHQLTYNQQLLVLVDQVVEEQVEALQLVRHKWVVQEQQILEEEVVEMVPLDMLLVETLDQVVLVW
tara:strand:+ start:365 stop:658 length:294 start_codon:yes stop_codon:yes gene_type:complete